MDDLVPFLLPDSGEERSMELRYGFFEFDEGGVDGRMFSLAGAKVLPK